MLAPSNALQHLTGLGRGVPMLFFHTPRCGGKFVERAFGRPARRCFLVRHARLAGHLFWIEYRDRLQEMGLDIRDFTTFSVVRNPFSWRVSWYTYLQNDTGGRRSGLPEIQKKIARMSFSDFVDFISDPGTPTTQSFRPRAQVSDWIIDESEKIAVDHVLRQERLAEDLQGLAARYGLWLRLPKQRVNASSPVTRSYRQYYRDEDVEKVAALHPRDLAMFGYRF